MLNENESYRKIRKNMKRALIDLMIVPVNKYDRRRYSALTEYKAPKKKIVGNANENATFSKTGWRLPNAGAVIY